MEERIILSNYQEYLVDILTFIHGFLFIMKIEKEIITLMRNSFDS